MTMENQNEPLRAPDNRPRRDASYGWGYAAGELWAKSDLLEKTRVAKIASLDEVLRHRAPSEMVEAAMSQPWMTGLGARLAGRTALGLLVSELFGEGSMAAFLRGFPDEYLEGFIAGVASQVREIARADA